MASDVKLADKALYVKLEVRMEAEALISAFGGGVQTAGRRSREDVPTAQAGHGVRFVFRA